MKFATIVKEKLTVVYAIKWFRLYLQDNEFRIVSEHRPLPWLKHFTGENVRLRRQLTTLQLINIDCEKVCVSLPGQNKLSEKF